MNTDIQTVVSLLQLKKEAHKMAEQKRESIVRWAQWELRFFLV